MLIPRVTFEKSKIFPLILLNYLKPNEKCESFNNEQSSIFILSEIDKLNSLRIMGEINLDLLNLNIPDLFKDKFDSDRSIKDILEI